MQWIELIKRIANLITQFLRNREVRELKKAGRLEERNRSLEEAIKKAKEQDKKLRDIKNMPYNDKLDKLGWVRDGKKTNPKPKRFN
jgi:hypothetical protein